MMRANNLFLFLLASLAPPADAETVLVKKYIEGCDVLHLLTVYQSGSEVFATSYVEEFFPLCSPRQIYRSVKVEFDYPSIALKENPESLPSVNDFRILYTQGRSVEDYDYQIGPGWISSLSIGEVYIRNYPWVYHREMGWLYCQEAGVAQDVSDSPFQIKEVLSFWFWSLREGKWIYSQNTE
jgi:hypothetical protein